MLPIERLLGMLLASFCFSSVIVFGRHAHKNYYSVVLWPCQGFCCTHWERELIWDRPCHRWWYKLLRCLLAYLWAQALLFFCSTCSLKLPLLQKAKAVVAIVNITRITDCEEQREGHMNWIFEQTPPPHFCFKVECKKGGGGTIFENLQSTMWPVF